MKTSLWTTLVVACCALPLFTGCIAEEEKPRGVRTIPNDDLDDVDDGVGGDDGLEACEPGEVRACKVQVDEKNCFVGEEYCEEDGYWSDCLEPDDIPTGLNES